MVKFVMPQTRTYKFKDDPDKLEVSITFYTSIDYKINCPACHKRHFLTETYGGLYCGNAQTHLNIYEADLDKRLSQYGLDEVINNKMPIS